MRYTLEKYNGPGSRHTCPACGSKKRFTRYIDTETGRYLADNVGRCDRESSCGYHVKPGDYFAANGEHKNLRKPKIRHFQKPGIHGQGLRYKKGSQAICEAKLAALTPGFMDKLELIETLSDYDQNNFVQFLLRLFPSDPEDVWKAVSDYLIGTHRTGRTVFWQIDQSRRIRTGKAIAYDRETGKRDKRSFPFFLHPKDGFELRQCFFGEHLLTKYPGLPIAITEAEKSAVLGSICKGVFPDLVWLACGGKSNLKAERVEGLGRDRKIILFPDADGFGKWQEVALDASKRGLSVSVSDLIEKQATDAERANGCDIADYLIREQAKRNDPAIRETFREVIEFELTQTMAQKRLSLEQAEAEIITSGFYDEAIRAVRGSV